MWVVGPRSIGMKAMSAGFNFMKAYKRQKDRRSCRQDADTPIRQKKEGDAWCYG